MCIKIPEKINKLEDKSSNLLKGYN
jgi:hydrogenase maturation factor